MNHHTNIGGGTVATRRREALSVLRDRKGPAEDSAEASDAGASDAAKPALDLGAKPNMCWLPKKTLQVDKRYQRELKSTASAKLIAQLQKNFCWAHCAPLIVTDNADGTYNIVDGQHRWKAALAIPQITLLP